MAMFDLNYTPNHTKLGSSVNVKHFFSSFCPPPPPRPVFLQWALQGTCSNDEGGFTVFQRSLETWALSHPADWEGLESPTIIPGSDLHPHPSHTQIRLSLLWLIRRTGSTLITICQWLAWANCRRLLCIHVLIMYIIFLCSSVSFQPRLFVLFYYQLTVFSNISKLQQWFADGFWVFKVAVWNLCHIKKNKCSKQNLIYVIILSLCLKLKVLDIFCDYVTAGKTEQQSSTSRNEGCWCQCEISQDGHPNIAVPSSWGSSNNASEKDPIQYEMYTNRSRQDFRVFSFSCFFFFLFLWRLYL